ALAFDHIEVRLLEQGRRKLASLGVLLDDQRNRHRGIGLCHRALLGRPDPSIASAIVSCRFEVPAAFAVQELQSKTGTTIIELRVPLTRPKLVSQAHNEQRTSDAVTPASLPLDDCITSIRTEWADSKAQPRPCHGPSPSLAKEPHCKWSHNRRGSSRHKRA